MKRLIVFTAVIAAGLAPLVAWAGARIGEPAPAFSLPDTADSVHALADYAGRIVVLEWTNYDCPFVKKHYDSGHMQALQKEFTGQGVVWLSINSSAPGKQGQYPAEKWAALIAERNASPTAVLLDPSGDVGRAYGAKTTPHMFVIDKAGVLVYTGAIDDKSSYDPATLAGARNYVREVLTALLDGRTVPTKATTPYGCSVKY